MNVFVIDSPLQLLCAEEARSHFKIEPENSFLVVVQHDFEAKMLFTIVKGWSLEDWPNIVLIAKARVLNVAHLILEVRRVSSLISERVERVFISHDRMLFRALGRAVKGEEFWLLDDGTGTLRVVENRKVSPEKLGKRRFKDIIIGGIGLKGEELKKLNYFTFLDIEPLPGEAVIRHGFPMLREGLPKIKRNPDCVLLLGVGIVEQGIVTESEYRSYLDFVEKYYEGKTIYYAPHRVENVQNLKRRFERSSIQVLSLSRPIEIELIEQTLPENPGVLAGFWSTAFTTCRAIFGDDLEISAFRVEESAIQDPFLKEGMNFCYEYFNKIGSIKIVDIQ
ncbi:alpha-2,8-polysialyltransferase family protein [bacterium]|nr:alpha-2,8-polysialyltransferase family protein [bacterium]